VSSLRCGLCEINYPRDYKSDRCPVCAFKLRYRHELRPDLNWQLQAQRRWDLRNRKITWDITGHPIAPTPVTIVSLHQGDKAYQFIPHGELLDAGYRNLEDFDVVRVNAGYYELQGYNNETHSWWVERVGDYTELELPVEVVDEDEPADDEEDEDWPDA